VRERERAREREREDQQVHNMKGLFSPTKHNTSFLFHANVSFLPPIGTVHASASSGGALLSSYDASHLGILCTVAFLAGLGKGGVGGLAAVAVALAALYAPPGQTQSTLAVMVPMMMVLDISVSVTNCRTVLWKSVCSFLFPWSSLGMLAGYFALGSISDVAVKFFTGLVLTVAVLVQGHTVFKDKFGGGGDGGGGSSVAPNLFMAAPSSDFRQHDPHRASSASTKSGGGEWRVTAFLAFTGGFATMLCNLMGPLLDLYLMMNKVRDERCCCFCSG
jgi:hypothetical protein